MVKRRSLSHNKRLTIFESYDKSCYVCKGSLNGKSWHLDHIIALGCGGEDTIENLAPICLECHDIKTNKPNGDKSIAAKIKRIESNHIGYKAEKVKIPSRKFDQQFKPRFRDINEDLL